MPTLARAPARVTASGPRLPVSSPGCPPAITTHTGRVHKSKSMDSAVLRCVTEIGRLTTIRPPPRSPGLRKTTRNLSTRSPKTLLGTIGPVWAECRRACSACLPVRRYIRRGLGTYLLVGTAPLLLWTLKRGGPRPYCSLPRSPAENTYHSLMLFLPCTWVHTYILPSPHGRCPPTLRLAHVRARSECVHKVT